MVPDGWRPPRGYSWPPFEPGHFVTLKHGARSERIVKPIADHFAAVLVEDAPWLASRVFASTVAAWAWAEAQAHLLRTWIDEHGILDDDGEERPACRSLTAVEKRAANLRTELGVTPQSMVKLLAGLSTVQSEAAQDGLEALRAAGRQLVEGWEASDRRALTGQHEDGDHVDGREEAK
jgi:hypothetical protein